MIANAPVQFHIKQLYFIRKLPFCCGGRVELHLELLQLRNRNGTFWSSRSRQVFVQLNTIMTFKTREMPSDVLKRAKIEYNLDAFGIAVLNN